MIRKTDGIYILIYITLNQSAPSTVNIKSLYFKMENMYIDCLNDCKSICN